MRGTIKNITHDRGFGFILGEDGNTMFFHVSGFESPITFHQMAIDAQLEYRVIESDRGPRAVDIKYISEEK